MNGYCNCTLLVLLLTSVYISDVVAPPSPAPTPTPTPQPAYTTGDWSVCSVTCGGGTQTRTVSCSGSDGCSGTEPASSQSCNTAACTCDPDCKVVNVDNTTDALWTVKSDPHFYANLNLTANVGDGILFKYSTSHDVYKLATKWHYDSCSFEDAVLLGDTSDGSGSGYQYNVTGEDDERRIYFACSTGSHCQLGQKVDVEIGDFEHSTLQSATDMIITSGVYNFNSIEEVWCFVEHCPDSALTYYNNNVTRATEMCEADAYNLIGFVYRKKENPNFVRSEAYYLQALQLVSDFCGARSYLGELYVQTDNLTFATSTLNKLIEDCGTDCAETKSLVEAWQDKGWCSDLPAGVQCSNDLGNSVFGMSVLVFVHVLYTFIA